jgi:hypothetical protein
MQVFYHGKNEIGGSTLASIIRHVFVQGAAIKAFMRVCDDYTTSLTHLQMREFIQSHRYTRNNLMAPNLKRSRIN